MLWFNLWALPDSSVSYNLIILPVYTKSGSALLKGSTFKLLMYSYLLAPLPNLTRMKFA